MHLNKLACLRSNELAADFPPAKRILRESHPDRAMKDFGHSWIRERHDRDERHQDRIETLEWAILIFIVLGVIVEGADLVLHLFGHSDAGQNR